MHCCKTSLPRNATQRNARCSNSSFASTTMACNFMLSCQLVALWISKHGQQLNETL